MRVKTRVGMSIILIPAIFLGTMCGLSYMQAEDSDDVNAVYGQAGFSFWYEVYNYFEGLQILLNAVAVALIVRALSKIDVMQYVSCCCWTSKTARQPSVSSATYYPMFRLAVGLMWYPVAQTITRFGASWYELSYSDLHLRSLPLHRPTPTGKCKPLSFSLIQFWSDAICGNRIFHHFCDQFRGNLPTFL